MHIFGDKSSFAIAFRPYEWFQTCHAYAYCHLILGGHFIGNPDEPCMLGTWTLMVEELRNHIKASKGKLSVPLFNGLTEREVFELIFKSNQLQEDFDPDYAYLPPQPTNNLWVKHHIMIDETTDALNKRANEKCITSKI